MHNFLFTKIQMVKCLSGDLHPPNMRSDQEVTAIASAKLCALLHVHLCNPAGCLLMRQFRDNLLTDTPYHCEMP